MESSTHGACTHIVKYKPPHSGEDDDESVGPFYSSSASLGEKSISSDRSDHNYHDQNTKTMTTTTTEKAMIDIGRLLSCVRGVDMSGDLFAPPPRTHQGIYGERSRRRSRNCCSSNNSVVETSASKRPHHVTTTTTMMTSDDVSFLLRLYDKLSGRSNNHNHNNNSSSSSSQHVQQHVAPVISHIPTHHHHHGNHHMLRHNNKSMREAETDNGRRSLATDHPALAVKRRQAFGVGDSSSVQGASSSVCRRRHTPRVDRYACLVPPPMSDGGGCWTPTPTKRERERERDDDVFVPDTIVYWLAYVCDPMSVGLVLHDGVMLQRRVAEFRRSVIGDVLQDKEAVSIFRRMPGNRAGRAYRWTNETILASLSRLDFDELIPEILLFYVTARTGVTIITWDMGTSREYRSMSCCTGAGAGDETSTKEGEKEEKVVVLARFSIAAGFRAFSSSADGSDIFLSRDASELILAHLNGFGARISA